MAAPDAPDQRIEVLIADVDCTIEVAVADGDPTLGHAIVAALRNDDPDDIVTELRRELGESGVAGHARRRP